VPMTNERRSIFGVVIMALPYAFAAA